MNSFEKRRIELWTNNTVDNLTDMIENDNLTDDEIKAIEKTIDILKKRIK